MSVINACRGLFLGVGAEETLSLLTHPVVSFGFSFAYSDIQAFWNLGVEG